MRRDTFTMEKEALNFIQGRLSKYGYHYVEPNFDKDGADFFIYKAIDKVSTAILLKVQSKGRDLSENSSNIVIPKDYVVKNFLLFIYLKTNDMDNDFLYLFGQSDIMKWNSDSVNYKLYIPIDFVVRSENEMYRFTEQRARCVIDTLFEYESKKRQIDSYFDVEKLKTIKIIYKAWQISGAIPGFKYSNKTINDYFDDNLFEALSFNEFVLLLIAIVSPSSVDDGYQGIDWAFFCFHSFELRNVNVTINTIGYSETIDDCYTYDRSYWNVISYFDGNENIEGFHLRLGDIEEYYDAYIFRDGNYFLEYGETGLHS